MTWLRPREASRDAAHDQSGIAAVEFALILPIVLVLFIGSFETTNLVLAYMKLEASAETAADLVAQTKVIDSNGNANYLRATDFTNITNAANQVLTPLPTSGGQLTIAYASLTYSTGSPVVDWHYEVNRATAITTGNLPSSIDLSQLGNESSGSTDSVIIVRLAYAYSSPISHVLNSAYTLSEWAFNRPRYMNCVPTYLNTGNVCP